MTLLQIRKNAYMTKIDIIHILHGFEGDITEYLPRGDRKALECAEGTKLSYD